MLRALHVWPLFSPQLTNGSDYYAYMLSQQLVVQGIQVDVLATQCLRFAPQSLFALRWQNDPHLLNEIADGINIQRFPVTYATPNLWAHSLSQLIMRRWQAEERQYGPAPQDSPQLEHYYHQRASARPKWYDWLFLLGLGPWSWQLWRRLQQAMPQYDVVMVGFVPFALVWQTIFWARRYHKPVVLLPLFHPDDVYHHHRVFYECFAKASAILAQTSYSVNLFKQIAPTSNPIQIGAGVDFKSFSAADINGARFRAKYGLENYRVVLCVGRKEYGKRYDLAVEAVNHLADERVKLVLIGEDVDQQAIHSPHVVFLGKVSRADLIDAYDACELLIFPSQHESFGMVMLEAWMRRKPVLCNAHCRPVASIVAHGDDGFACNGSADFAERIRQLLEDSDLAARLGANGYHKTTTHYTWEIIGQKVSQLYRQLAASA